MRRLLRATFLVVLLLWTLIIHQYHVGTLAPPEVPADEQGEAHWIGKDEAGINQLIVKGTPYTRGLKAGELTRELLQQQEDALIPFVQAWIPNPLLLQLGTLGLIGYFYGADKFIERDDLLEMYGTSMSAPKNYEFIADAYTRQLAYHGLHEVGQMMVDKGIDMGCTVAAVRHENGWILGRNFDFEGGRVFDRDKILKWVFPAKGLAHVSVIWAGMVGGVTGINEKGVYISINAAGSTDFKRVGTPSTLVLYKILREATNVEQAVQILREAKMFITDIFVVMDAHGNLVRAEKSPHKTDVIEAAGPFVVANHLTGPSFANDETNQMRRQEQTTLAREARALELAGAISPKLSAQDKTSKILELLRDKGRDQNGKPLHLGNRAAIDALIATHAVIVDSARGYLYVSQGPSVSGPMIGYDLAKSFAEQKPVQAGILPRDPLVSDELYDQIKSAAHEIQQAGHLIRWKKCEAARALLEAMSATAKTQGQYYHTLGDALSCLGQAEAARLNWSKAYELRPAYAAARRDLRKKLAK